MIRPIMYMEMQLLHTICIIYYKERFSNRKGCISIYNLRFEYNRTLTERSKLNGRFQKNTNIP